MMVIARKLGEEAANDDAYVDTCAHRVESRLQQAIERLNRSR